jgi:hypothetical protein
VSGRVRPRAFRVDGDLEGDRMRIVYRRAGDQQSDGGRDVPSRLRERISRGPRWQVGLDVRRDPMHCYDNQSTRHVRNSVGSVRRPSH